MFLVSFHPEFPDGNLFVGRCPDISMIQVVAIL